MTALSNALARRARGARGAAVADSMMAAKMARCNGSPLRVPRPQRRPRQATGATHTAALNASSYAWRRSRRPCKLLPAAEVARSWVTSTLRLAAFLEHNPARYGNVGQIVQMPGT